MTVAAVGSTQSEDVLRSLLQRAWAHAHALRPAAALACIGHRCGGPTAPPRLRVVRSLPRAGFSWLATRVVRQVTPPTRCASAVSRTSPQSMTAGKLPRRHHRRGHRAAHAAARHGKEARRREVHAALTASGMKMMTESGTVGGRRPTSSRDSRRELSAGRSI